MATTSRVDSSSEEEAVARGVQPYRFEPRRRVNDDEESDADETEDETPFQQAIDFDARVQQPAEEWCTCGGCETMEAPVMNFCCQELEELQGRLFADDLDCIKQHREFPMVVLEEAVLRTALVAMKDVKKTSFREPIGERTFRLAAYRQFTWWTHNRLGHRVRRVIPSCVVMAIRRKFPDVEGHYVGFREVNDDDDGAYPD